MSLSCFNDRILHQLPNANRELAILMFGILFRMVSHYVDEYSSLESENMRDKTNRNSDSKCNEFVLAEAVAKSVAGSIFHLCTSSPDNVEKAAAVSIDIYYYCFLYFIIYIINHGKGIIILYIILNNN